MVVKNLGLAETVERAGNAYPKTGGDIAGYINATGEITGANIIRSTGRSTVEIKSTAVPELTSRIGDAAWFHAYIPQKNGTIALLDDIPTPTPPTNIVQSVGQSTASVMSQKSVTDALNKKFNKTGGETSGEITAAGIVRARAVSTIEINANDSRPRITSRVGSEQWNNAYLQQKHGTIAYLDDIPAQTHIVQSTGQSTSSVMSQKSVTDTINGHGIGYSQSWVNVTGNRSAGAWYTNHTGRPIFIAVFVARDSNGGTEQSSASIAFSQNGNVIKLPLIRGANSGGAQRGAGSTIIPVGATYTVTTEFGGEINAWWELR
ncbi:hypothetical protein LY16_01762 [Xenorhabdus doucetiae]|uniref:Tail fiber protein n=1 Tax=Xenorhabdus doucetiae TaxID=351671 RepID=A0ABY3NS89_9GAMM|nr:hypothetical protein LY16_01762 [Xenorhabdus doucetiae]